MNMTKVEKRMLMVGASALILTVAVMPHVALAGTGGAALDDVWLSISDFTQGTLGRIIAGLMVVAGLGAGIMRQSLGGFIVGLGAGIGLYNTPTVLETMVSATLPVVHAAPKVGASAAAHADTALNLMSPAIFSLQSLAQGIPFG